MNAGEYILAVEQGASPGDMGDAVNKLSDAQCKALYDDLVARKYLKLVKALWYNYTTQAFRW